MYFVICRVLYQLIIKHLHMRSAPGNKKNKHAYTDRVKIPVKKYGPEVFRTLIQFIHCGMANISDKNVIGRFAF